MSTEERRRSDERIAESNAQHDDGDEGDDLSVGDVFEQDEDKTTWASHPAALPFLKHIASARLKDIYTTDSQVKIKQLELEKETEKLASQNYQSFIQTAHHSRVIFEEFQAVEEHASGLSQALPELSSSCASFLDSATPANEDRKVALTMLAHQQQLLEILEMPQLMDACIKGKYFDSAIKLRSHAQRLRRHFYDVAIISTVCDDIENATQYMLQGIVEQLEGEIEMAECVQLVGYLRTLGVFEEHELKTLFLNARTVWLEKSLQVSDRDVHRYLSEVIERTRRPLFEAIQQFRAAFSSSSAPFLAASAPRGTSSADGKRGDILYDWALRRVNVLLVTLKTYLPLVNEKMGSILSLAMRAGASFRRCGLDFTPFLAPIFEASILKVYTTRMKAAFHHFTTAIPSLAVMHIGLLNSRPEMPQVILAGHVHVPVSLTTHSAIATLTNSAIAALNNLRECAPIPLGPSCAKVLMGCIVSVATKLKEHFLDVVESLHAKERECYEKLCSLFCLTLAPTLLRCIVAIFPDHLYKPKSSSYTRDHAYGLEPLLDLKASLCPILDSICPDACDTLRSTPVFPKKSQPIVDLAASQKQQQQQQQQKKLSLQSQAAKDSSTHTVATNVVANDAPSPTSNLSPDAAAPTDGAEAATRVPSEGDGGDDSPDVAVVVAASADQPIFSVDDDDRGNDGTPALPRDDPSNDHASDHASKPDSARKGSEGEERGLIGSSHRNEGAEEVGPRHTLEGGRSHSPPPLEADSTVPSAPLDASSGPLAELHAQLLANPPLLASFRSHLASIADADGRITRAVLRKELRANAEIDVPIRNLRPLLSELDPDKTMHIRVGDLFPATPLS